MRSELAAIIEALSIREQVLDASRIKAWLVRNGGKNASELASALRGHNFVTISRVLAFFRTIDEDSFRRLLDETFEVIRVEKPSNKPSFNATNSGSREILAMALRHYPTVPALKENIVRFARCPDATLAAVAYERLPEIKDSEAVGLLVSGLFHESAEVRALAVEGLRKVKVEAVLPHLNHLIADKNRLVRQSVAGLLDKVDSSVQREIVNQLEFDEDHEVRMIVSDFLERG